MVFEAEQQDPKRLIALQVISEFRARVGVGWVTEESRPRNVRPIAPARS